MVHEVIGARWPAAGDLPCVSLLQNHRLETGRASVIQQQVICGCMLQQVVRVVNARFICTVWLVFLHLDRNKLQESCVWLQRGCRLTDCNLPSDPHFSAQVFAAPGMKIN